MATRINNKHFIPGFERPNTRLNNGIHKPKKSLSPVYEDRTKRFKSVINDNKRKKDTRIVKLKTVPESDVQTPKDISNNNASSGECIPQLPNNITVNPDPEKFVLTKWGDVTVLGRRKSVADNDAATTDDEDIFPLDDGVLVTVNTDEFDYEDDSQEDTAQQPKQADPAVVNQQQEPGCSSALSAAEAKLLEENPHFQSIVDKLLDRRLKQLPEKSISTDQKRDDRRGVKGKCNTNSKVSKGVLELVKSPSDTTIYVPALTKQSSNHNMGNVDQNEISNFVDMVRAQTTKETDQPPPVRSQEVSNKA